MYKSLLKLDRRLAVIAVLQNPVKMRIIEKEEGYLYCCCGEYYGIRK